MASVLQLSEGFSNPVAYHIQVRPDDPRLIGHPMLEKPDWKRRAVPLMVWGDGGAFTHAGNPIMFVCLGFLLMLAFSWKSGDY